MRGFWTRTESAALDDHRYYHHSRVNQALHFVSATSFVCAYADGVPDPAMPALIGWLVAMTTRRWATSSSSRGHTIRSTRPPTITRKKSSRYNIKPKLCCSPCGPASPLLLVLESDAARGLRTPMPCAELVRHVGELWLVVGLAGIAFRAIQLFVLKDFQTDWLGHQDRHRSFHDIKLYHGTAPTAGRQAAAGTVSIRSPKPSARDRRGIPVKVSKAAV